ncbi:hypothetical protein E4U52_005146 [Claviceps spartinae]|nr:hypothetical protein E4U52_005146 [Claviceps spartinae]
MGSQWPFDMGNPSPLLHWMDNSIMAYAEALPVFRHQDWQYYPFGMGMMPIYDREGPGYLSGSYLASNVGAYVDSGSPSREMDYFSSPQIIDSINHANTDYIDTQSEVYFDYSGFPIDGSANLIPTGEAVGLVSTKTEHNSCWDHPGLAARAHQFLEISSQRAELIADPHLSWPGSYMDPSISTSVGTSSSSMPSPDIGSLLLGMPSPGIGSSPLSMPSLSTSSCPEDGVYQASVAATQPSPAGQSPQVQRDYLYSPSPVRSQPAIFSAKDYQDQILKEDRERGWSYKTIKAVRNFSVSESTLRWRHRNLVKSSHQRPRKPTWTERDVDLLRTAVPHFTRTAGRRRVSWKAVSEFIHTHGDSPFAFAFANCHKKWLEVTRPGNVTPSV